MDVNQPMLSDPYLTPEQQLMVDIGWLELCHALREESAADPEENDEGS